MAALLMRISVVCPVYNAAPDDLREAVQSVLRQAGPELTELMLADDASSAPGTLAALSELAAADPRVQVVRLPANGGPSRARSAALAAASGDWIAFIDADDLWARDGLSSLLAAHRRWPERNWIAANTSVIDRDGSVAPSTRLSSICQGTRLDSDVVELSGPTLTRALIGGDWIHLGACLIRRATLLAAGGFEGDHFYSEDWLLLLRLSTVEPLLYLERETYLYRRQQPSLTTASPRRLTTAQLSSTKAAMRDPLLRGFRREIRWVLYSRTKALAANNLILGRHAAALRFALEAWMLDPREIGELALLLRLLVERDPRRLAERIRDYSKALLLRGDEYAS